LLFPFEAVVALYGGKELILRPLNECPDLGDNVLEEEVLQFQDQGAI